MTLPGKFREHCYYNCMIRLAEDAFHTAQAKVNVGKQRQNYTKYKNELAEKDSVLSWATNESDAVDHLAVEFSRSSVQLASTVVVRSHMHSVG